MNKYELMYIVSSDVAEDQREALIEKYKSFVESKGGVVTGVDKLGMKKFAYVINFKTEGFYVLMNFEADGTVISEMNKSMNLSDAIVRQMFIRK